MRHAIAIATALIALAHAAAAQDHARPDSSGQRAVANASADSPPDSGAARGSGTWRVWMLGTQLNVIAQHLAPFSSAYSGANSLTASGDTKVSHAYGVYLGGRLAAGIQAYLDIEMIRGSGVTLSPSTKA